MKSYQVDDLSILLEKEGSCEFQKVSYPIRYGRFNEVRTPDYVFQLDLNGQLKYIQGRDQRWPHRSEWLKRTVGNDWVYYSAGDYKGIYDLFGEHYFPVLSYPSNSIMGDRMMGNKVVRSALDAWEDLQDRMKGMLSDSLSQSLKEFLTSATKNDRRILERKSQRLHDLIGGLVTVLPPDSRHVDYEMIPLIVADGCLYDCGFCRVKSFRGFMPRGQENILEQIRNLREFYDRDLSNYNAVFLGFHDALGASREVLEFAAVSAYEKWGFEYSYMKKARLFLFGTVDSLIRSEEILFETLNRLPFSTYLNIGLESADPDTLAFLEKPITAGKVREAFQRMTAINRTYDRIEVTSNFVFGNDLPLRHLTSLVELINNQSGNRFNKGIVYLSPLVDDQNWNIRKRRETITKFYGIKTHCRLPVFLYLIQRL